MVKSNNRITAHIAVQLPNNVHYSSTFWLIFIHLYRFASCLKSHSQPEYMASNPFTTKSLCPCCCEIHYIQDLQCPDTQGDKQDLQVPRYTSWHRRCSWNAVDCWLLRTRLDTQEFSQQEKQGWIHNQAQCRVSGIFVKSVVCLYILLTSTCGILKMHPGFSPSYLTVEFMLTCGLFPPRLFYQHLCFEWL